MSTNISIKELPINQSCLTKNNTSMRQVEYNSSSACIHRIEHKEIKCKINVFVRGEIMIVNISEITVELYAHPEQIGLGCVENKMVGFTITHEQQIINVIISVNIINVLFDEQDKITQLQLNFGINLTGCDNFFECFENIIIDNKTQIFVQCNNLSEHCNLKLNKTVFHNYIAITNNIKSTQSNKILKNIVFPLRKLDSSCVRCYVFEDYKQVHKDEQLKYIPFQQLYTLDLKDNFERKLEVGNLPEQLRNLDLGHDFNKELIPGVLPQELHTLNLGYDFNKELKPGVFPQQLHTLYLSVHFNQELMPGVLPQGLHTLYLGSCFNQELMLGVLSQGLYTLNLSWNFNQELKPGVFPQGLHILNLGHEFNKELKPGVLPQQLHTLDLGWRFNQELKPGVLPQQLHTLNLGYDFNKELKPGVFPQQLQIIKISKKYAYMELLYEISKSTNFKIETY